MSEAMPPPYPPSTRAKGWRFEIDYEQIDRSDTWPIAAEIPMAQHALLMMWLVAWQQEPCGSFPSDEAVIRAKCRIPPAVWSKCRGVLMRGWWLASDGRLYHETLTARVFEMMKRRRSDADRQAAARDRERRIHEAGVTHAEVTPKSHVTPPGLLPESSTDNRQPNTEEKTKTKTRAARGAALPLPSVSAEALMAAGFDGQTAAEFIAHKNAQKAPLTERAWRDHIREAGKAGWSPLQAAEKVMAKGWKGFEAKYVAGEALQRNGASAPALNRQEAIEADNRRVGKQWLEQQGVTP